MNKAILAGALTLVVSSAAYAVDTPLANGSFELPAPTGFTQTIQNWNVSFSGSAPAQYAGPPALYSGTFTFFGTKYPPGAVPDGSAFSMLANLGSGTVSMQSDAATIASPGTHAFQVIDRNLQFRYVYLTNEPATSAVQDRFQVRVDFYTDATASVATGQSILVNVKTSPYLNDTGIGSSPFKDATNTATNVFNDSVGTGANAFNLFNVDIGQFFGQFARVTFIVDNQNATQNQANGNGLGVTGVFLDNVVLNPEPSSVALFALGAMGLGGFAWRRRSAKKPAA